jgi:hypothetical protein
MNREENAMPENTPRVEIRPASGLRSASQRHALVFHGSNLDNVINMTDADLAELRQALADYPEE